MRAGHVTLSGSSGLELTGDDAPRRRDARWRRRRLMLDALHSWERALLKLGRLPLRRTECPAAPAR